MLDDPRSRTFTNTFVGQWLGTQDLGGRVVPLLTEISRITRPSGARICARSRCCCSTASWRRTAACSDLLNADYTYLTERLVKFYQIEGKVPEVQDNDFHLVKWPDNRRGGVLGLGAVLAMTSHYEQTSPVLRGAWALDTLLGTPVPPPPPGRAAARSRRADVKKVSMRETPGGASRGSRMLGVPQADGPDRLRAGELRLDGPLAREGDERQADGCIGRIAVGREVQWSGGTAAGAAEPQGRFPAALSGKVLGYALGPQPAGWR